MNATIIAAYAGAGKTKAAELYPKKVIDFISMPYKYHLSKDYSDSEAEDCKANLNNIMQIEWPYNYVEAIKSNLHEEKILLIPTDFYTLALLREEEIPYWLVYPKQEAKESYLQRYLTRGNNEVFIDIFIGAWDKFINTFQKDTYGKHMVLEPHQFVCDILPIIMQTESLNS